MRLIESDKGWNIIPEEILSGQRQKCDKERLVWWLSSCVRQTLHSLTVTYWVTTDSYFIGYLMLCLVKSNVYYLLYLSNVFKKNGHSEVTWRHSVTSATTLLFSTMCLQPASVQSCVAWTHRACNYNHLLNPMLVTFVPVKLYCLQQGFPTVIDLKPIHDG